MVAGCRHKATPPRVPPVAPDAAALTSARASEQDVLAAYDAAIAVASGADAIQLTADRATHLTHLTALGGPINPPSPPPDSISLVLRDSAASLRSAAVGAVDGSKAALLASIAASHEVMADE
jgi:hypothetical protein